jgi:hypothetical protein
MSSASRIYPVVSSTYTPTLAKASEYLFKLTPSSKVSPNFNPYKRAKIVFKAVPTVSALARVLSTIVVTAAVAYSKLKPTVSPIETNFSRPAEISSVLAAVSAPNLVITSP